MFIGNPQFVYHDAFVAMIHNDFKIFVAQFTFFSCYPDATKIPAYSTRKRVDSTL